MAEEFAGVHVIKFQKMTNPDVDPEWLDPEYRGSQLN